MIITTSNVSNYWVFTCRLWFQSEMPFLALLEEVSLGLALEVTQPRVASVPSLLLDGRCDVTKQLPAGATMSSFPAMMESIT